MVIIYVWLLIIAIIIIIGIGFIGKSIKNTINRDYKYQIKLHKEGYRRSNFPIVKVKLRNKYYFFIVDSGANMNLIAKSCYKDIVGNGQIEASKQMDIKGIGSSEETITSTPIVLETVEIESDSFKEEFGILDSWEYTRREVSKVSGLNIVGVLGAPFCNTAKWVLDFEELIIWVKKSK